MIFYTHQAMELKEFQLTKEIVINYESLVVSRLLNWHRDKGKQWQVEECKEGEGFQILRRDDKEIFSDGKFVVAKGGSGDREIDYVEAIPWKEPSAKDAIQRLAVLQGRLVERSQAKEVDFVVNLWGVVGGLQVSWQLQDVVSLIKKRKFKQEWIVIKEREFVLFNNQENWEISEFPVSVLELFAKKKFPGKFKIANSFQEVWQDLENG